MTSSVTAKATVSSKIEASVTIDGVTKKQNFTVAEAANHASSVFDTLYLLQEQQLPLYREIGNILIQFKLICNNNNNAYKALIDQTELASYRSQDLYDCFWIATHWDKVYQMSESGRLDGLGVSSITKIVREAHPELRKKKSAKTSPSAGNTSKGKTTRGGNSQERVEEVIKNTVFETVKAKSEKELAEQVYDQLKSLGFNRTKFSRELGKLFTANANKTS
jgi:hypothetical protein